MVTKPNLPTWWVECKLLYSTCYYMYTVAIIVTQKLQLRIIQCDQGIRPYTCMSLLFLVPGRWVAFEQPGFSGELYVLEKGLYAGPEDWGAQTPKISSIQPVFHVRHYLEWFICYLLVTYFQFNGSSFSEINEILLFLLKRLRPTTYCTVGHRSKKSGLLLTLFWEIMMCFQEVYSDSI